MTIFTNISQTNSGGSDIDVEKIANTDLSNLTAVGETHFANKSLSNIDAVGQAKFLNKQMITNCLISATSGLVTASGNTLTVPSGLIFLIPNGVDATTSMIKNIETITSVTTTFTESSSQYGTRVLFYNSDNTLTSYLQSEIEYDNVLKYWKANGSKIVAKNLATYYWDGSDISSFIPEQVATIEMSSMGDTEYIAHQAMPSDRYDDLTLGNDNDPLVAPADGYFVINKASTDAGQRVGFTNGLTDTLVYSTAAGQFLATYCHVSKGQTVRVRFTADGTTAVFRFVYANGAK